MNDPKIKALKFVLPTDDEALENIGQMLTATNQPAENQIALRLWLTDLLQDAGRMPRDPVEGEAETDEAA